MKHFGQTFVVMSVNNFLRIMQVILKLIFKKKKKIEVFPWHELKIIFKVRGSYHCFQVKFNAM